MMKIKFITLIILSFFGLFGSMSSDISSGDIANLRDKGILKSNFSNNYSIHLDGYEEEFGYVIESCCYDLLNCSNEKRQEVTEGILDVYRNINPELVSEIGDNATFVIRRIS